MLVSLTIGILKEAEAGEDRVAAIPDTVKKYKGFSGTTILVEKGAGEKASYTDAAYKEAGANLSSRSDVLKKSDIVLCVKTPPEKDLGSLKKNALLIGLLNPHDAGKNIGKWANNNITTLSMEMVPRITRAQAMDVLSSQANLAGYKAVLDAANHFTRAFPMMMTAAGTIAPARVFVMGAGVAGLQAIATAKRLGAIVSATDVRPAAKEQVASLGANFIAVEDEEFKQAESAGGYAKEMSKEYQAKQAALVEDTLTKQDIVITTALIPGRPAPVLLTKKMVESMKPGSVIVDMAVERGGNCELSESDKVVQKNGVTIIGYKNIPARLATDTSALYAKNIFNLIKLLLDDKGKLNPDWNDEILKGMTITHDGNIVHTLFADAASAKPSSKTTSTAAVKKQSAKKPASKKTDAKVAKKPKTSKTSKTTKPAKKSGTKK